MKYLFIIPLMLFFSMYEKDNTSIVGNYKSTKESYCNPNMIINIKKNLKTNNYYFTIYKNKKRIDNGKLTIYTNDNDQRVFGMKKIAGIYTNDSIIIQNSGNAMNQYTNFENCNAKYLIFVREQNGSKTCQK
ncbi:hypothetical protein [Chryseobacterium turcicum]|uniref:Uncharacterized protein n=1 Tax=Chryseobacterium turcicum TaxID=2898076 RepID=A0A9Q3YUQ1_9FLAO|nr:hypothetical protein [Chryseobacterium turcicum]MCD1115993.1 hypothetical protein [Chryseobacterium turcicum]